MKKGNEASSTDLAVNGAKVVSRPITISKNDKGFALYLPPLMFGGLAAIIGGTGLTSGVSFDVLMPTMTFLGSIMGGASVFVTTATLAIAKSQAIAGAFQDPHKNYPGLPSALRKSRSNRVLVNTFHIRKQDELEVTSYVDFSENVPKSSATHIVHQYLVKTKKGYQAEQEIIPNAEMIWDVSADALVEVYGVEEKTRSSKGIEV